MSEFDPTSPATLPFSEGMQRAICGHILLGNGTSRQLLARLKKGLFLNPRTSQVFGLLVDISKRINRNCSPAEVKDSPELARASSEDRVIIGEEICMCVALANQHGLDGLLPQVSEWLKNRHFLESMSKAATLYNTKRPEEVKQAFTVLSNFVATDFSFETNLNEKALTELTLRRTSHTATGNLLNFTYLDDFLAAPPPPISWVLKGLIPAAGVCIMAAAPKTTKTWMAIEMALSVATGSAAFGRYAGTAPSPAAYFFAEDNASNIYARFRSLIAGQPRSEKERSSFRNLSFIAQGHLDLSKDNDLAALIAACWRLEKLPTVIFLDPFRNIHTLDENDNTEMSCVMENLRLLRDILGCSIVFLHHLRKGKEGEAPTGSSMRGATAIHAAVDATMLINCVDKKDNNHWTTDVTVDVKGGRAAGEFHLSLDVEDNDNGSATRAVWTHSTEDEEDRVRREILDLMKSGTVQNGRDISLAVRKNKAKTLVILKDLVEEGFLQRSGKDRQKGSGWKLAEE
jgi:replicative DNA helicase